VLLIRNIEVVILPPQSNVRQEHGQCANAESTVNLVAGSFDAKIPSAKGDLQIFPKQTIKIFYRHNVFRALIFMNIFDKFFELLIGNNDCRLSYKHAVQ
jgi:hypothetical protein